MYQLVDTNSLFKLTYIILVSCENQKERQIVVFLKIFNKNLCQCHQHCLVTKVVSNHIYLNIWGVTEIQLRHVFLKVGGKKKKKLYIHTCIFHPSHSSILTEEAKMKASANGLVLLGNFGRRWWQNSFWWYVFGGGVAIEHCN